MKPDRRSPPRRAAPAGGADSAWIWGVHAALAALANPARRVREVVATQNAAARLPAGVAATLVEPRALDRLLPDGAVHQGLAVRADPLAPLALDEALARTDGPLLMLDQVSDPQNVGAIFRSCAAFGAAALIQQDRKAPPITGALAKAAAGAIEAVADVRVVNIARAIEEARHAGWLAVGLAGEARLTLADALADPRPALIVLGAEGKGLRELVAASCETTARIEIAAGVDSLNVSNAAAVALYEAARRADAGAAQIAAAKAYLAAMEARDLAAAAAFLAPRAQLVFPGGKRFSTLEAVVAWGAGRYRRIAKRVARAHAAEGGSTVYLEGELFGEDSAGQVFSGVRFIDAFRFEGGLIAEQRVWNDLAEAGVTAPDEG